MGDFSREEVVAFLKSFGLDENGDEIKATESVEKPAEEANQIDVAGTTKGDTFLTTTSYLNRAVKEMMSKVSEVKKLPSDPSTSMLLKAIKVDLVTIKAGIKSKDPKQRKAVLDRINSYNSKMDAIISKAAKATEPEQEAKPSVPVNAGAPVATEAIDAEELEALSVVDDLDSMIAYDDFDEAEEALTEEENKEDTSATESATTAEEPKSEETKVEENATESVTEPEAASDELVDKAFEAALNLIERVLTSEM